MTSSADTRKKYGKLFQNIISLSAAQAFSAILPLVTVPYLVRVLGPSKLGLTAFAHSLTLYFVIIIDYGFNLTATQKVSINRNNREFLQYYFSVILSAKMFLMIVSSLVLIALCLFFGKIRKDYLLYVVSFGFAVGSTFFPQWLFLGLENAKTLSVFNISSKIVLVVSIFVLVRAPNDFVLVNASYSISQLLIGFASVLYIIVVYKYHPRIPRFSDIILELKDGWSVFYSTVAVSIYTTSNTFILGCFSSQSVVGYYSAGERIIKAARMIFQPISQALFPHMSKQIEQSRIKAIAFIKRTSIILGAAALLTSVSVLLFAGYISRAVLGEEYTESTNVIRILSFAPFLIVLSNMFAVQALLNLGCKREYRIIFSIACIFHILVSLILVIPFEHIGTSISWLATEALVTLISLYYLLSVVYGRKK